MNSTGFEVFDFGIPAPSPDGSSSGSSRGGLSEDESTQFDDENTSWHGDIGKEDQHLFDRLDNELMTSKLFDDFAAVDSATDLDSFLGFDGMGMEAMYPDVAAFGGPKKRTAQQASLGDGLAARKHTTTDKLAQRNTRPAPLQTAVDPSLQHMFAQPLTSIPSGASNASDRTKVVSPQSTPKASGTPRMKQTSSFRGVSCCGKDRKWQARIRDANRVRYLGRYQTEVEAALIYDVAARELKGDKAPTNFIKMDEHTTEVLKQAFVQHGGVPHELAHLIARSRVKTTAPKTQPGISPSSSNAKKSLASAGRSVKSRGFLSPSGPGDFKMTLNNPADFFQTAAMPLYH